jgi:hypothetical protein
MFIKFSTQMSFSIKLFLFCINEFQFAQCFSLNFEHTFFELIEKEENLLIFSKVQSKNSILKLNLCTHFIFVCTLKEFIGRIWTFYYLCMFCAAEIIHFYKSKFHNISILSLIKSKPINLFANKKSFCNEYKKKKEKNWRVELCLRVSFRVLWQARIVQSWAKIYCWIEKSKTGKM